MCQDMLLTKLKKILVVEDDISIGEVIRIVLAQEGGYTPFIIEEAQEALQAAKNLKPDLFIIDYHLAGTTGIHLYDQIHRTDGLQEIPAIITTASIENHGKDLAVRGLIGLAKPFDIDELLTIVKRVIR